MAETGKFATSQTKARSDKSFFSYLRPGPALKSPELEAEDAMRRVIRSLEKDRKQGRSK